MTIALSARRVYSWLWSAIVILTALSLTGQTLKYQLGSSKWLRLSDMLDLDLEGSVPTWYATVTLLLCAAAVATIAAAKKASGDRHAAHWRGLAIIFLALSIDEAAHLHEMTIKPLRHALELDGFLYYGWVIPAAALLIVLGFAYARFLLQLPPETRVLFLTAATIFIVGAVGMEMISAQHYASGGRLRYYVLLTTIEEIFEMVGVAIFFYALLEFIRVHVGPISFRIFGPSWSHGDATSGLEVTSGRASGSRPHPGS